MDASLNTKLMKLGVIPVIAIDDVERAEPLADALIGGGLPVAEITFRTPAAAAVIQRLHDRRPDLLLGAGTLLDVESLEGAHQAGARFGLAPGFSLEVVVRASRIGMPFFPGVMTPTDIQNALSAGLRVVKFFPALQAGGLPMLNALAAPHASLGLRFIPTGGVTLETVASWLEQKSVLAVGGTWIATKDMIASGAWDAIRRNAAAASDVVARLRP